MLVFEARTVTRRFGAVTAVDRLDLEVEQGEIFCLLGANGAGKTTTINLFLGFLAPDEGRLRVCDVDPVADPKAARRHLAYIPESVALYPQLSALENVDLFCRMGGTRLVRDQIVSLLVRTGLTEDQIERPVRNYSKGMRQKVGLAIGYARNARGLLLDEPLSGLDPEAANEFCSELRTIRETGAAVLMTTHDLFRAKELGGTIGIMRAGRLVERLRSEDVDARELERLYLHHVRAPSDACAAL